MTLVTLYKAKQILAMGYIIHLKQASSNTNQSSQEIMTSKEGHNSTELFEGQALLYRHMLSFLTPMCLRWAIQLRIPNIIQNHGKPITLPELLSVLQVPQSKACYVPRFMRFLAHNGLFAIVKEEEGEEEAYALTPASHLLVEGTNHCLSPVVMSLLNLRVFDANLRMGNWIMGEEHTLYETAFGVSFWDLMHNNPERMSGFNESMASDSQMINLALGNCNSVFGGLESIVDVGGGNGATGKIICEAFPKLQYIVLDHPHVVANLPGSDTLSYVGGDMFESIPQADAVLLKWVLHDWSDEECRRILKNCKDAISSSTKGKGGKMIIIDIVINEKQDKDEMMTQTKLLFDINMILCGGKERSEKEWKQLFLESGFQQYKIFPLFGLRSLIEVYV